MFLAYLKTRRRQVLIFFLFAAIFLLSFILYRIPVEAALYPTALCVIAGACFLLFDYRKCKKKHDELEMIKRQTSFMIESLPEPETLCEQDCREIILSLKVENAALESVFTARYRDMTEYYSVWAHQIKTPIASMKLTLQNEDSSAARRLSSDLTRIEQYVEMVLAFLRLDSPSTDYVFREYSIDPLVRSCIKKFAPDFISKKIKLEYKPTDKTIVTDEKWFSFVLEQVLSNAVKYTNEGCVKIYTEENRFLRIEDTGIGIAAQDIPRIFEKGYTGVNGRVDKSASGIGLYLCRRICKNLGIRISAQSEPGKGTVICLDLPETNEN